MEYIHLPKKKFAEKILVALEKTNTPFIALCADDDFILLDSLYKGYDVLNNFKIFNTVLGKTITFHENFDGFFYGSKLKLTKDINYNSYTNASMLFADNHQVLWGMYSKSSIQKSFEIIKKAKLKNDNFIEIIIGAISCYEGGVKFLDDIWSVRELSLQEHWGDRHSSITNIFYKNVEIDYKKVKTLIDQSTNKGYTDHIIKTLLKLDALKTIKLRLKAYLKNILPDWLIFKLNTEKEKMGYQNSKEKYLSMNKLNISIDSKLLKVINVLQNK
tara:strand:- start:344 stop:1162 length:819 start_codon:yes stop_codon:yes gene_type:complete